MSATFQPRDDQFSASEPVSVASMPRKPRTRWPLMAGAAIVLAALAFGGGYGVANATAAKPAGRTFSGGTGQGAGAGGGGASGTVASVSATQMTITTQAGSSRLVLLTPTTTVTQVTSTAAAASAIANGNQVTVVGTANPDGSVTATQVVIGGAGAFGRGAGRIPGASPAASTGP